MKTAMEGRARVEIALGLIVSDGFFSLAYTLHLLGSDSVGIWHFLGMGIILSVLLTACWLIYDEYWLVKRELAGEVVKKLRLKEMKEGASIEFDGRRYHVDAINRGDREILISRVGQPGRIVVQIEDL